MRFAKNSARWHIVRMRTEPGTFAKAIFIVDDDGPKSITNDAEAVAHDINVMFPGCRLFYRDTIGNWDELVHDFGKFTGFKSGTDGWATP